MDLSDDSASEYAASDSAHSGDSRVEVDEDEFLEAEAEINGLLDNEHPGTTTKRPSKLTEDFEGKLYDGNRKPREYKNIRTLESFVKFHLNQGKAKERHRKRKIKITRSLQTF